MAANLHDTQHASPSLILCHQLILATGFVVGVVAAYLANQLDLDFSRELQRAARLGIVSPTTLAGHAETKDVVLYATTLLFPVLFAVAPWLVWARTRRPQLEPLVCVEYGPGRGSVRGWVFALTAVLAWYVLGYFNLRFFHEANTGWSLLGEEGETLAWAQRILHGDVYGKDFPCIYGPMLLYPLVWVFKIFGESIAVQRYYLYGLNVAAQLIFVAFLFRTMRVKAVFVLSALVYFIAFPPLHLHSLNTNFLRVALGLLPLLLTYHYLEREGRFHLPLIGAVLGQSLLFSQEVGLCALISTVVFLGAARMARRTPGDLLAELPLLLAGLVASLAPMLLFFYLKGALPGFLRGIYEYPSYFSLGFNALPFPGYRHLLTAPLASGIAFPYLIMFAYAFFAISFALRMILGQRDHTVLLRVSLLLFGVLLFRTALGRSDPYHAYFSSPPLFLLVPLYIDLRIARLRSPVSAWVKGWQLLVLAFLLGIFYLLVKFTFLGMVHEPTRKVVNIQYRFTPAERDVLASVEARGGIAFDDATAATVTDIARFLETNTRPGDYVYFFPNEALYYFLFNRKNPTRFDVAYLAATREQRRALIDDLEKNRPRFVIYSLDTWRLDDIAEEVQVPEVLAYLRQHYRPHLEMAHVRVLQRIGT